MCRAIAYSIENFTGDRGVVSESPDQDREVFAVGPGQFLQQLRVGIHPVYFNHNALYHAIQGIALVMIYMGARALSAPPPVPTS